MVPSRHWIKDKIPGVTKTWNTNKKTQNKQVKANEELNLAQILPVNYKPVDIIEVVNKQTHLTSEECG
jgi:hypothetical protein